MIGDILHEYLHWMTDELFRKYNINPVLYDKNGANFTELSGLMQNKQECLFERHKLLCSKEDYLWISKYENSYYFTYLATDPSTAHSEYFVAKTLPVNLNIILDTTYLLTNFRNPVHKQRIVETYYFLSNEDGLGITKDFPIFKACNQTNSKNKLVIKYTGTDDHIIKLPFTYYLYYQLGSFSKYSWMEFISSERDHLTQLKDWIKIEEDGKHIGRFLKHSAIIINSYNHFNLDSEEMKIVRDSLALLKKIRTAFTNIQLGNTYVSLSLLINPSKDDLMKVFTDKDIYYVFADFHTVNGEWTLSKDTGDFYQQIVSMDLNHIQLLRVFHCDSLISRPNGKSIVVTMLEKGVKRVDGSIEKQSIKDYLVYLFTFFSQTGFRLLFFEETALFKKMEQLINDLHK